MIYGVGVFFGCAATFLSRVALQHPSILSVVLVAMSLAAVVVFEKLPYERQRLAENSELAAVTHQARVAKATN